MFDRTVFRPALTVAALLFGGALLVSAADTSFAGDATPALQTIKPYAGTSRVPRGVGGYSTTLSEIWGAPEMPPAPKDFGPHFDFPAGGSESLNGPPSRSPYPN